MGSLTIAGSLSIELDDDLMAHIHVVVVTKLRRGEPVLLQWTGADHHVREAWIHPSMLVVATYDAPNLPPLDRTWVERIMVAANSVPGISIDVADLHRHSCVAPFASRPWRDTGSMPVASEPGRVVPEHRR